MAMALPLGKLTIIVGAGILGSVLAKEGRMSNVSDFFSGALKIAFKKVRQDDTSTSSSKPRTDSLMAQVNILRQELQLLASNGPVSVVTSSNSGGSRYGVIIVVVVVGSGYVWWKGWKLPDMMFATRRSLSDACNTIARQLEMVYSSIAVTRRHLSSRIDRVDSSLEEFAELSATTREEVSELRGDTRAISVDVQSVHHAVQTLESKINRIEGNQNITIEGVRMLIARTVDLSRTAESIQAAPSSSSMPALEFLQMSLPLSRHESLPSASMSELPSPIASSNGSHKGKRSLQSAASSSGLKELYGISDATETTSSSSSSSPEVLTSRVHHITREIEIGNSSFGMLGKLPAYGSSFSAITRTSFQSFK